jgi:hypothetical protein
LADDASHMVAIPIEVLELLDFDLDGNLDVYVSNGFISGTSLKDT